MANKTVHKLKIFGVRDAHVLPGLLRVAYFTDRVDFYPGHAQRGHAICNSFRMFDIGAVKDDYNAKRDILILENSDAA